MTESDAYSERGRYTRVQSEDAMRQQSLGPHTTGLEYRVYKRRWFGLAQLVFLNIIVSWNVCEPTPLPPGARALMSEEA